MQLTKLQKQTLDAISQTDLVKYFYWTGGTLLSAHYLHHRTSEDLDFFSDDLIQEEAVLAQINKIKKMLGFTKMRHITNLNRQQYILQKGKEQLKLEFVYFPFKSISKPKKVRNYPVKIASLKDIAVNKIFALYERGEPKDAIDLYYINKKEKFNIDELFKLATKKFDNIDKATLASKAIEAVERIDEIKPLLEKKVNTQKLKSEIEDLFSKSGAKYLSTLLV
ncbi:nucleotidyl transferase AbiEii/AbiGii toxin family protein [Patescibacteria group bacterium]|nr:nucleotidyl transferase AbiEii/AbiGii toxin family protein [Patescibacteria group bacterium]